MIDLKNISKYYGKNRALSDISFSVSDKGIVGLLGNNGAGKSTLLNIISGYYIPDEGEYRVDGVLLGTDVKEIRKKIGYLPEKPPLYDAMTVREYLMFVARLKGLPRNGIKKNIDELIERLKLQLVEKKLVRNLSKGYQQRAGIAQAMLGEPDVLIMDEPTVGLDPTQVIDFRELVTDYGKNHIVIISSHILSEISELCNRIVILNHGKITKDIELLEGSETRYAKLYFSLGVKKENFEKLMEHQQERFMYEYLREEKNGNTQWEISAQMSIEELSGEILKIIIENEIVVFEMRPDKLSIEQVFIESVS